jgi:hypothetical protein
MENFPSAGFVFNQYRSLRADGQSMLHKERIDSLTPGHTFLERIYFRRWRFDSPVWGTAMFRADAYRSVGGLNEQFGFLADVDLWLRMCERWDVAYVARPLITLPSRSDVPRLFLLGSRAERSVLGRIFWQARRRHFAGRPATLALELGRHSAYRAMSLGYAAAIRLRRAGLKSLQPPHPAAGSR